MVFSEFKPSKIKYFYKKLNYVYYFSFLNSILTFILMIILFPDVNSELGLKDIPSYALIIKYGPFNWAIVFGLIFHTIWIYLNFNNMILFIKLVRLLISSTMTFFITLLSLQNRKYNNKHWILFISIIVLISTNIFTVGINFFRLRLGFGLSFFFLLLSLIFLLDFNSPNTKKKVFYYLLTSMLMIFCALIHELVFILILGLLFGLFLVYIKTFKFKFIFFMLFEIIYLVSALSLAFFKFNISIPYGPVLKINFDLQNPIYIIFIPIFIIFFLLLISFQLFIIQFNKFNNEEKFNFIFILPVLIISILLSVPILIISPVFIFLYIIFGFFTFDLLLKKEKLDNRLIIFYTIFFIISLFNRTEQYLRIDFSNINIIYQSFQVEVILIIIILLSFSHLLLIDLKPNIKLKILKNLNSTKYKFLYLFFLSLVILNSFVLASSNPSFGDNSNEIFYQKDNEFDILSINMASNIKLFENNSQKSFPVITNDERLSTRLSLLLQQLPFPSFWGNDANIWETQNLTKIVNYFETKYTLSENHCFFLAITIINYNFTNTLKISNITLIENYQYGYLFFVSKC